MPLRSPLHVLAVLFALPFSGALLEGYEERLQAAKDHSLKTGSTALMRMSATNHPCHDEVFRYCRGLERTADVCLMQHRQSLSVECAADVDKRRWLDVACAVDLRQHCTRASMMAQGILSCYVKLVRDADRLRTSGDCLAAIARAGKIRSYLAVPEADLFGQAEEGDSSVPTEVRKRITEFGQVTAPRKPLADEAGEAEVRAEASSGWVRDEAPPPPRLRGGPTMRHKRRRPPPEAGRPEYRPLSSS